MKRFTIRVLTLSVTIILGCQVNNLLAQEVSINASGAAANTNSILDVSSTTKGALFPRMDTGQRNTLGTVLAAAELATPGSTEGMTVYDRSVDAYYYWDGSGWIKILSAGAISLDDAYDGGRTIDADAGPVVITSSSGNSLEVDKGIKVAEDQWIGIDAAAERFEFDGSGNAIGLKAADMTIDDGRWIGFTVATGRIQFDDTNDEIEIMDAELGIGTEDPAYLLDIVAENAGADLVLAKFEAQRASGNGSSTGIKIVGDRVNATRIGYIEFDNKNNGTEFPVASIVVNEVGAGNNGQLAIHLGDNAGGLEEKMVLDNGGNLQLDGLAGGGVVVANASGVMDNLAVGSNDDVLKISGGAITWGPASVTSLSVTSLTGGTDGDILYNNGGTWTPLNEPAAPGSYALTTPGNGGAPAWQTTTAIGDDLGNHTATQNIEIATFAIAASDGIVNIDDNLTVNGKVVSNGINETSDGRFKKNIESISGALSTLLKLEGVTYNWRTEEFPGMKFSTDKEYGVIAQQIEKYVPELVHTAEDGYKSVQYSHMVPLLIEAIKEQNALLSKQDSEIAKLKASVESLSDYLSTSKK